MKKLLSVLLSVFVAVSFASCGVSDSKTEKKETVKEEKVIKEDPIKMENLVWEVKDGIFNGNRMLVFKYTNNSNYTIVDFVVKFTLKDDITNEQLDIFDAVKTEAELTDEEVKELYIQGYNHKISDPGEVLESSPCIINGTFRAVEDIEQFNLMEPDMASTAYLKDGKIYSTYYDFKTKEYTQDSKGGVEAFKWPVTEIAKRVPKPDLIIGQAITNDEDDLFFTGYGIDKDFFTDYIEKCKEAGYTFTSDIVNTMCEAETKDGYNLTLYFDEADEEISIQLEKIEQ